MSLPSVTPVTNTVNNYKIYFYFDTSGSLDASLSALRSMVDSLTLLLQAEPYNIPAENIVEVDNNQERWVSWLNQSDDQYLVIAVINESSSVYHGSSDTGPTSAWNTDYNNAVSAMQTATNSAALIYGVADLGETANNIDVFMEQHLPRAVLGTNGYPSSPSLADLGVEYETYVPQGRSASEYLSDIETFVFGQLEGETQNCDDCLKNLRSQSFVIGNGESTVFTIDRTNIQNLDGVKNFFLEYEVDNVIDMTYAFDVNIFDETNTQVNDYSVSYTSSSIVITFTSPPPANSRIVTFKYIDLGE